MIHSHFTWEKERKAPATYIVGNSFTLQYFPHFRFGRTISLLPCCYCCSCSCCHHCTRARRFSMMASSTKQQLMCEKKGLHIRKLQKRSCGSIKTHLNQSCSRLRQQNCLESSHNDGRPSGTSSERSAATERQRMREKRRQSCYCRTRI